MERNNRNKILDGIIGIFKSNNNNYEKFELDPSKPTKYLDLMKVYYEGSYETFTEQEQNVIIRRTKITINRSFFKIINLAFSEVKILLTSPNFELVANYFLKLIEDFILLFSNESLPNGEKKNDELMNLNLKDLYGFNHYKSAVIALLGKEIKQEVESVKLENLHLPDLELKTQKDQIRLLYDLGVISFLQNKYEATLKNNNNQTAHLLAQILKLSKSSIQPTVNALLNDDPRSKNYPKESNETKAIIDKLYSAEPK